ncbi:hypothetical protein [Kitasatospora sp. NPDC093679]|uniref:hypothetical protein n=1 Tax=Kitasatospora sp. NPDC093679 TaxID=3154983 RepID=UPI00344A239F
MRHHGAVQKAVLPAVIAILGSGGFTVRESAYEYEALTVEVPAGLGVRAPWVPPGAVRGRLGGAGERCGSGPGVPGRFTRTAAAAGRGGGPVLD